MRRMIPTLICTLLLWQALTSQPDAEEGRTPLVGSSLAAWRQPHGGWQIVGDVRAGGEGDRFLVPTPGQGAMVNGKTGRASNILSTLEHGDVQAHIEFVVPKGSNSGIYFQGRYEIQVLDSWGVEELKHGDCGGIYQRWKDGQGYDGHPPRKNASRAPGQWQSFDVIFRAPRFDTDGNKVANGRFVKVTHNDVVVHENVELTGPTRAATYSDEKPTGPLMLQGDHGPVAYRNIWIKPITLE